MKAYKRSIWLLALFGICSSSFLYHPPAYTDGPVKTVIIDAGHGGKDPGALGKNVYEKDVALAVALLLKEKLNENLPDLNVVMTRDDDTFVELDERGKIAKDKNGDFFVSIHCNGMVDKKFFGTETYIMGFRQGQKRYERIVKENEAVLFEEDHKEMYGNFDPESPEGIIFFRMLKSAFRKESTRMAEKVQKQYTSRLGRKNLGVKQGPLIVLYKSGMPAILTEMGFITNPSEERFLASEVGRVYLANAIYRAIKEYNLELAFESNGY